MKNIILIMTVILAPAMPVATASAAEAILPIKARIIRCVTHEERQKMCREENVCCQFLDTKITGETAAGTADEQSNLDISVIENAKAHEIHQDGLSSLALE